MVLGRKWSRRGAGSWTSGRPGRPPGRPRGARAGWHQPARAGWHRLRPVQVDFKLILLQIGKEEKDFKLPLVGKYNRGKKDMDLHASC